MQTHSRGFSVTEWQLSSSRLECQPLNTHTHTHTHTHTDRGSGFWQAITESWSEDQERRGYKTSIFSDLIPFILVLFIKPNITNHNLPHRALQHTTSLCPYDPHSWSGKTPQKNPLTGEKTVETSGRATEEGSLFQDGQTCNRCRTEQINMRDSGAQGLWRRSWVGDMQ